jgi:hypothetical protein
MVQEKGSEQLRREWLEHRHFRYRGCAPDADDPKRMAGNPELPVGAHHGPDAFQAEGQKERAVREAAAVEVCLGCPVMVQCDAYASSVVWVGGVPRLAEQDGVWGGRRSLERHKALIAARLEAAAAPDRRFQTPQKQAVLKALASFWDPFDVAAEASRVLAVLLGNGCPGMDVRTANWQRSSLVRLLGLPKDVSRMRALGVARERGLLEGLEVRADDGTVPAVPPPTKLADSAAPSSSVDSGTPVASVAAPAGLPVPRARVRRRRGRVVVMPGQLSFDDALPGAPVVPLFSASSVPLEAAA